jgi:hypothetical protein
MRRIGPLLRAKTNLTLNARPDMPFDTASARKVIISLQAHRSHPGGEMMVKAADLLNDALTDSVGAMTAIRAAEADALKAKRDNEGALLEIKELRERVAVGDAAVETLKQVAAAKKGAGKIAEAFLIERGLIAPVEVKP